MASGREPLVVQARRDHKTAIRDDANHAATIGAPNLETRRARRSQGFTPSGYSLPLRRG